MKKNIWVTAIPVFILVCVLFASLSPSFASAKEIVIASGSWDSKRLK